MRITKRRRRQLVEYGRKGGSSRSAAKIEAVRRNGAKHVARVKSLAEIFAEEAQKFRKDHPELFEV
jgi:hypothetical protein